MAASYNYLFETGFSFVKAAKRLVEENGDDENGILAPPIYLLVGFALELFIKAYLVNKGQGDDDLKKVGHDLKKGFALAKGLGLPEPDMIQPAVDGMDPHHRGHAFRYIKDGNLVAPKPAPLVERVDNWSQPLGHLLLDEEAKSDDGLPLDRSAVRR